MDNQDLPWGDISDARVIDIPGAKSKGGKWPHLAGIILERLEQLPTTRAVRIELLETDRQSAEYRRNQISAAVRNIHGKGTVNSRLVKENGVFVAYFMRGKNWRNYSNGQ